MSLYTKYASVLMEALPINLDALSPEQRARFDAQVKAAGVEFLSHGLYGPKVGEPATHRSKKSINGAVLVPLTPDELRAAKDKADSKIKKAAKEKDDFQNRQVALAAKYAAKAQHGRPANRIDPSVPKIPKISPMDASVYLELNKPEFQQFITVHRPTPNPTAKGSMRELRVTRNSCYNTLGELIRLPRTTVKQNNEFRQQMLDFIKTYGIVATGDDGLISARALKRKGDTGGDLLFKKYKAPSLYIENLAAAAGIVIPSVSNIEEDINNRLNEASKVDIAGPILSADDRLRGAGLRKIFSELPANDRIQNKYKQVFTPLGPNGEFYPSGEANSKLYFQHSVNGNKLNDNMIELLTEIQQNASTDVFPDATTIRFNQSIDYMKTAFITHKNRMLGIADVFDTLTADERKDAVQTSYAQLAEELHIANKNIAERIFKNIAEVSLYDEEIASGVECYLPSAQNFPVGDKIVVYRNEQTYIEKVSSISVKFNENNYGSYGVPTNIERLLTYHPDASTWGDNNQPMKARVGDVGYETGVHGAILNDPVIFNNYAKTSGFIDVFDKDTLEQIRAIGQEIQSNTIAAKPTMGADVDSNSRNVIPSGMNTLKTHELIVNTQLKLSAIINNPDEKYRTKLLSVVGKHNYKTLTKKDKRGNPIPHAAMAIYSMMTFSHLLKTGKGFESVIHNHQEYDNGKLVSTTYRGTDKLRDWQFRWEPYVSDSSNMAVGVGFNQLSDPDVTVADDHIYTKSEVLP